MTTKHPTGLSLKQRIVGGYALLVILFALVTAIAIVGFIQTRRRTLSLERIGHQQVLQQEISQAAVAIANQTERFTSEGHVSAADQAKVLNAQLRAQLEEIRRTAASTCSALSTTCSTWPRSRPGALRWRSRHLIPMA
jgi:hypothetical protein